MQGLQRLPPDGRRNAWPNSFRVRKAAGSRWCDLWSHPLGWEVRLFAAGQVVQSRVCRTQDEVLTTMEVWKGEHTGRRQ
jgi:hypothetical protein